MKLYTSYFYQIRFFPPNLVPLSTAVFDPAWYHANKGQKWQFKDKRGVLNGLRAEVFMPGKSCEGLCHGPENCPYQPHNCPFLNEYRKQLDALDFKATMERFKRLHDNICRVEHFDTVNFALIFHEAPSKACSERTAVQQWFIRNMYLIAEWNKEFPEKGVDLEIF